MLTDVLAHQLVLAPSMQGRGQVGDAVPKAGVVQRQVFLPPRPGQVDVAGFLGKDVL
jgi:hypothetical protein